MKVIDHYPYDDRVIAVFDRAREYPRVGDHFRDPDTGLIMVVESIDRTLADCRIKRYQVTA